MLPAPPPPDAAPPSTVEAPTDRVALGLVLGFGTMAASGLGLGLARAWFFDHEGSASLDYDRFNLVHTGVVVAHLSLLVAGAFDLQRRTRGTANIGARIALGATLVMLAGLVIQQYLYRVHLRSDFSNFDDYGAVVIWVDRARTTAWLVLAVGLVVAGWHVRRVRLLAAPLIVTVLIAAPYEFYADELGDLLYGEPFTASPYRGAIVGGIVDGALAALAIAVLYASPPRVDALGFDRAGRGLNLAAVGLFVQVWVLLISMLLVVMMYGSRGGGGDGLAKLYAVGAPLIIAIAVLVTIGGVLAAGGLVAPGAPRLRMYAAGAGFAWMFTVTAIQVTALLKAMSGLEGGESLSSDGLEIAQALPILKPALALATLALLGWGLAGIGRMLGSAELADRAGRSIGVVIVCQLAAIMIPYAMMSSRGLSPGGAMFALVAVATAGAISLVSLARVCRACGAALRARHDVPVANLFA